MVAGLTYSGSAYFDVARLDGRSRQAENPDVMGRGRPRERDVEGPSVAAPSDRSDGPPDRESKAPEQAALGNSLDDATRRSRGEKGHPRTEPRTIKPAALNGWPKLSARVMSAKPPPAYSTAPPRLCMAWRAVPDRGEPGSQGKAAATR